MNYNKLLPLVKQAGAEACDSFQDVQDLMIKVETCFKTFQKAHDTYVEALEEETLEKDAETVLDAQFKYLNEVEDNFMSIRKLYNKFIKNTNADRLANDAALEQKKNALDSIPTLKFHSYMNICQQ